ncbi:MAG: hypothetical protein ACXAC5_02355 [Promethearchaeota archaeon]|jgi:hypothetical protein
MNYYGKAQNVADRVLEAFKSGNVPKALATVFIDRGGRHIDRYSWTNRMLVALAGFSDAMGYGGQDKKTKKWTSGWRSVGRQVRKGEKCTLILAPCTRKTERDGEERTVIFGFRATAVFGIEQTDIAEPEVWEKHNKANEAAERFVETLPLCEVAEAWGYKLGTYRGKGSAYLGWHSRAGEIGLGVENLSVWAHELMHAADLKNGKLVEHGQHWRSETVAELGGTILMMMMGYEREADIGHAWKYINQYATTAKIELIKACTDCLKRTCEAVALILETAETVNGSDRYTAPDSETSGTDATEGATALAAA